MGTRMRHRPRATTQKPIEELGTEELKTTEQCFLTGRTTEIESPRCALASCGLENVEG